MLERFIEGAKTSSYRNMKGGKRRKKRDREEDLTETHRSLRYNQKIRVCFAILTRDISHFLYARLKKKKKELPNTFIFVI